MGAQIDDERAKRSSVMRAWRQATAHQEQMLFRAAFAPAAAAEPCFFRIALIASCYARSAPRQATPRQRKTKFYQAFQMLKQCRAKSLLASFWPLSWASRHRSRPLARMLPSPRRLTKRGLPRRGFWPAAGQGRALRAGVEIDLDPNTVTYCASPATPDRLRCSFLALRQCRLVEVLYPGPSIWTRRAALSPLRRQCDLSAARRAARPQGAGRA